MYFCVYVHISYIRCFTNSICDCITVSIYDWVTNTIYIWSSHELHNSTNEFYIYYRVTNSIRDCITVSIFSWVTNSIYTIKSWSPQVYIWILHTFSSHELHTWLHHNLHIWLSYEFYIYNQVTNSTTLHINSTYMIESRTPCMNSVYMIELRSPRVNSIYMCSSPDLHIWLSHEFHPWQWLRFTITIFTCEFYIYILDSRSPHMTKSQISPLTVIVACFEQSRTHPVNKRGHTNSIAIARQRSGALCCSVLQCVAVCCSVLKCVAACCSVLQCAAVCCSV